MFCFLYCITIKLYYYSCFLKNVWGKCGTKLSVLNVVHNCYFIQVLKTPDYNWIFVTSSFNHHFQPSTFPKYLFFSPFIIAKTFKIQHFKKVAVATFNIGCFHVFFALPFNHSTLDPVPLWTCGPICDAAHHCLWDIQSLVTAATYSIISLQLTLCLVSQNYSFILWLLVSCFSFSLLFSLFFAVVHFNYFLTLLLLCCFTDLLFSISLPWMWEQS